MRACKYFLSFNNFFKKHNNKLKVDNLFPTLLLKLCYPKLLLACIFHYYWPYNLAQ